MFRRLIARLIAMLPCLHEYVTDHDPNRRWGSMSHHPRYVKCVKCGALDSFSTPQSREPWRDW